MPNQPINVLQFICPTGYYGAERWVLAIAKNFNTEHVNCELAIPQEGDDKEHQLIQEFQQYNKPAFSIRVRHKFDYNVINHLVDLIKERQIDVIHTHGYKSDIIGILAARKAKIKVVVTPHGFENTKDKKLQLYIWLGCQMLRFSDKVAPLSKQLMNDVKRFGLTAKKLQYIQNGVDLLELNQQKKVENKKAEHQLTIGFIGQIISRKNVTDILDIFESIHKELPQAKLQLLGDGDCKKQLMDYADTLSSSNKIEFLGFKSDRLEYLKTFDLFVMTSSLEGIPRCLMEAMAMGIPVAAYNIPGIDQLIEHDNTGLLASYGDKASLKKYWLHLLTDKEQAKRITLSAQKYIDEHYSARRMANEYHHLFSTLLKE